MRGAWTIAAKDLRLLWRDKAGLFWVIAFPLAIAILFGTLMGGSGGRPRGMRVTLADEDGTDGSRGFARRLSESEALEVVPMGRAEAVEEVRKGKAVAYVVLGKGFGESAGFLAGGEAPIEVGLDPARKAEGALLQGVLMEAMFRTLQERFSDPAKMRESVEKGIAEIESDPSVRPDQRPVFLDYLSSTRRFLDAVDPELYRSAPVFGGGKLEPVAVAREEDRPRTAYEITFPQASVWALLGCVATFALSVVQERTQGTWLRLRVAPLRRAEILAGKAGACLIASLGVVAALLALGAVAFGLRIRAPLALAVAVLCAGLCFTGLMMLLATAGKTERAVGGGGWGIMLILSLFGGGMIPLFFLPAWMQAVGSLSPVKWAILTLEGAVWRGFTPAEMALPCAVLLGFGAAGFAAGLVLLRRADG